MQLFKEYILIGGLPAVVSCWCQSQSLEEAHKIQYELLSTYRNDFSKYSGRLDPARLEEVMMATPKLLGSKIIYSQINSDVQAASIKRAIDLLKKAKIICCVNGTAVNGVPLGAELRKKAFKMIFLDVGLCSNLTWRLAIPATAFGYVSAKSILDASFQQTW